MSEKLSSSFRMSRAHGATQPKLADPRPDSFFRVVSGILRYQDNRVLVILLMQNCCQSHLPWSRPRCGRLWSDWELPSSGRPGAWPILRFALPSCRDIDVAQAAFSLARLSFCGPLQGTCERGPKPWLKVSDALSPGWTCLRLWWTVYTLVLYRSHRASLIWVDA